MERKGVIWEKRKGKDPAAVSRGKERANKDGAELEVFGKKEKTFNQGFPTKEEMKRGDGEDLMEGEL